MSKILKSGVAATALVGLGVLAGCSGGSTYGTGVSQETQLLKDIGGIAALGGSSKKQRISYAPRPKLVKSPADGSLPTPAETDQSESAYFPTNPEERRAALRNGKANESWNKNVPNSGSGLVAGATAPEPSSRKRVVYKNPDHLQSAAELLAESTNGREERLARANEIKSGAGVGPRRYLTQPPKEYRTPAETAPKGVLGEVEKVPGQKSAGGLFDSWKTKD